MPRSGSRRRRPTPQPPARAPSQGVGPARRLLWPRPTRLQNRPDSHHRRSGSGGQVTGTAERKGLALNTSVLCPIIAIAADRETPIRSKFRTAVRRESLSSRPGYPAFVQAVSHAFLKSLIGLPSRWNTRGHTRGIDGSDRACGEPAASYRNVFARQRRRGGNRIERFRRTEMTKLIEVVQQAGRNVRGVGHFNVADLVLLKGVFEAARELRAPVIVGASE